MRRSRVAWPLPDPGDGPQPTNAMRWTERAPAVPGFYWQRGYGASPGQLRVVEVAESESDGDGSLHVFVGGWEPGRDVRSREFSRSEWAGPIPRPRERLHPPTGSTP